MFQLNSWSLWNRFVRCYLKFRSPKERLTFCHFWASSVPSFKINSYSAVFICFRFNFEKKYYGPRSLCSFFSCVVRFVFRYFFKCNFWFILSFYVCDFRFHCLESCPQTRPIRFIGCELLWLQTEVRNLVKPLIPPVWYFWSFKYINNQ